MRDAVAVLDIGKTNVKVVCFDDAGAMLFERSTPNVSLPAPPYLHADTEAIWAFLLGALGEAARAVRITAIVPTTHGCAGAFVDDADLVLPVLDYEEARVEEIEPDYAAIRPPFSLTLSPPLPNGLNQGRQIAWQMREFPDAVARAKRYLTYPQYWAWRLSGVAASDVTMLGAHSDLWAPKERAPSPLVAALGLTRLLSPIRPSWARLGPLRPEIAARVGIGADTQIVSGAHDSNASLLPHLASRAAPFTVVSTGTWVILMAVGLGVEHLNPADDMLANVDVEGRPTACARFMGGREFARILDLLHASGPRAPSRVRVERVLASGALGLPCFSGQGGPFAAQKSAIIGDVAPEDASALATLYVALLTDDLLGRLGATRGDLIVEGSFAANPMFAALLQAMLPEANVSSSSDSAGTARGAALLARWPDRSPPPPSEPAQKIDWGGALDGYRARWRAMVATPGDR